MKYIGSRVFFNFNFTTKIAQKHNFDLNLHNVAHEATSYRFLRKRCEVVFFWTSKLFEFRPGWNSTPSLERWDKAHLGGHELPNFKRSMVGTKKDPTSRAKAAETFGLLLLPQTTATRFGGKFGQDQEPITSLCQFFGAPHGGHGRESPYIVDGGTAGLNSVKCTPVLLRQIFLARSPELQAK